MKKVTLSKIRRKQKDYHLKIVHEALLPRNTLQSVGENWGISRERVRQIFLKVTGKPYSIIRKDLVKSSTKFLCPMCGKPKNPRSARIYCSKGCYGISRSYDWKSPKVCKYCGREFYPHRNWKASSIIKKCITGQYCCVNHYLLHRSRKNGRFSKDSLIIEKLARLGEGGEKNGS